MQKYNCEKEIELYRKIPLTTKSRYTNSKHFSTNEIISISTFNRLMNKKSISLEFLLSLLEQLKKYYDSETKEKIVNDDFTENKKTRLENWWENFDLKNWIVENDIPITTFTKEAHIGHVSYYNIVNKTHQTSLSNIKKIKDFVDNYKKNEKEEKQIKTSRDSELLKWHYNFDYDEFMLKHNITNRQIAEDINVAISTSWALTSKKYYIPSEKVLIKIKKYVESYEEKEEKMKEIEIIDEDIIETHCETNTNIANSNENEKLDTFIEKEEKCENECLNDVLKNLLKDRLTEEEKKLIEIFGGKIC